MFQEKKIPLRKVLINYVEGPPAGPAMVLIHGFPGHWQEFLPIFSALSKSYHLYAVDLRGNGKSGRTPGEYHASYYAKDLLAFLKGTLHTEAVILFGMSAGGLIAMEVASQLPEQINSLILGDSPIDLEWLISWMTSEAFKAIFSNFQSLASSNLSLREMENAIADIQFPGQDAAIRYGDQTGIDRKHLKQLAEVLSKLDPEALEYHAKGRAEEFLSDFHLERYLLKIKCPTLLIQADPAFGGMMTDRSVEFALSMLEKGSHVSLQQTGHDLGLESGQIGPLLENVIPFLSRF